MVEYLYVITGSWSEGPSLVQTRALSGIFTDDAQKSPTMAEAYELIMKNFRDQYRLSPSVGIGVLFFSLVPNVRL